MLMKCLDDDQPKFEVQCNITLIQPNLLVLTIV